MHELNSFRELARVERSRGCSFYAVDVQERGDPSADTYPTPERRKAQRKDLRLRLVAVVKRKLMTFEWVHAAGQFRDIKELAVADQPRVVCWAGGSLLVGMKKEYVIVDEDTNDTSEIFKVGANQEPVISRLPGNEFLLGKEPLFTWPPKSRAQQLGLADLDDPLDDSIDNPE